MNILSRTKTTKQGQTSGRERGKSNSKSANLRVAEKLFLTLIITFVLVQIFVFTIIRREFKSPLTLKEEQIYIGVELDDHNDEKAKNIEKMGEEQGQWLDNENVHKLGGLSCAAHGGPSDEIAVEMVYWRDIPQDSNFMSPFKHTKNNGPVQYMTFEPDEGGWNNIRMAMETVVVLAHAMGRTLVLPPAQGMYLLRKDRGKQNTDFSFADFFHLESLSNEHSGLDIISTEEFLKREAMAGNMKNKTTGESSFPPMNRTNWDGQDIKPLKEWLREVTLTPAWDPFNCLAAFPASGDPKDAQDLHNMLNKIHGGGYLNIDKYTDHPTPVNGTTIERMKEALAGRRNLCIYDNEMQAAPVVHFISHYKMNFRLLTHFYSFVFFEDWKQQLWTNRFVRDHLRYLDELQCAAARVVDKLHSIAKQEGEPDGQFDTFHVRRGDFQYKATRVEADVLYGASKDHIPEKATLYIATDERKKDFFNILKEHYNVYFLDDFKDLFKGLNTNYYGMLDQLIASKGRTFYGTYYSTFTGYINRMRGYSSTKFHLEGGNNGTINSYYFIPEGKRNEMRNYRALREPLWSREFPTSWYDIDKDVRTETVENP